MAEINGLTIHGTKEAAKSVYTVSINMAGVDCGDLSFMLDQAYGIQTRFLVRLLTGDGANIDVGRISGLTSPFLTIVISLCLVYFCLWLQTVRSRIWARRALLIMQGILLILSLSL